MSVIAAKRAQLGHAEAWQAFLCNYRLGASRGVTLHLREPRARRWLHRYGRGRKPPTDLHGIGHTARVMVWSAVLTRGTPWFESVVWATASRSACLGPVGGA
jgi:hypothetical protein